MGKQVTIKDIAEYAGVSYMTVSRVLRGGNEHSEETRRKVLQSAKKLGYRPNAIAKAFRTKKTGIVGLVMKRRDQRTVRSDMFYSRIIESIESELLVHDYNVLLSSIDTEQINNFELPVALNKGLVDGILILGVVERKYLSWLYERCPQLVVVDEAPEDIPCVFSANFQGGYIAAEYLYKKGHRTLAVMLGTGREYNFEVRLKGFAEFVEGKKDACLRILRCGLQAQERIKAIGDFLRVDPGVSAIFCANDDIAFDVMRGISKVGRKVPQDIAVVGYDDIDISSQVHPALTTVAVDKRKMGKKAVRLLMKLIKGKNEEDNLRIEIPVRLIERESG